MPTVPAKRQRRPEVFLLVLAFLAGVCWFMDYAFVEPARSEAARNAQEQYLTTKQGGSAEDLCAQAGRVSKAYASADDNHGAADWQSVQRSDCAATGSAPR